MPNAVADSVLANVSVCVQHRAILRKRLALLCEQSNFGRVFDIVDTPLHPRCWSETRCVWYTAQSYDYQTVSKRSARNRARVHVWGFVCVCLFSLCNDVCYGGNYNLLLGACGTFHESEVNTEDNVLEWTRSLRNTFCVALCMHHSDSLSNTYTDRPDCIDGTVCLLLETLIISSIVHLWSLETHITYAYERNVCT